MARRWRISLWIAFAVAITIASSDASGQELTVQREWRLVAIGLGVDPDLRVAELLAFTQVSLRRELPGLDITFDLERYKNYTGPTDVTDGRKLVQIALSAAEADGLAVGDYDIIFVLTPLDGSRYFGFSHAPYTDRDGRAARGALIQTRPFRIMHEGIVDGLEGRTPPGFAPDEPSPLLRRLRDPLKALLDATHDEAEQLFDLPVLREAILAPTIAHEFGHFLAPGDKDIRDGYQHPWMRHATGDDDNEEGHGVDCCMYKGRTAQFLAKKIVAMRGRVIVFCDACRRKLGCASAPPAVRERGEPELH